MPKALIWRSKAFHGEKHPRIIGAINEIGKRPFILAGVLGFAIMVPLANTSTNGMIKRFGGKNWKRLHRLTYVAAILVAMHYLLLVKQDITSLELIARSASIVLFLKFIQAATMNQYTVKIILMIATLAVSGCGLARKPAVPQDASLRAHIPGMEDVRYIVVEEDIPKMAQEGMDSFQKEKRHLASEGKATEPMPQAAYLALSGGGDDGAFGAGLLNGWSRTGQRPEFKLVTGVSTGALLAPFAFLGPSQDSTLETVYTRMSAEDILETRGYLAALSDDALADNAPLERLVKRYVTRDILDQIAKEYTKGRLLLIATTNLDARQAVIWNMTRIAASHHPGAMQLFHQIMLASAAIPGAFPPSMIDVEVDGGSYQEMHVDGGAMTQVFLYPPSMNFSGLEQWLSMQRTRKLYLIRNARIDSDWAEVQRQTLDIAGRAITSLIQTQGIGDLYRIYATSERDHIDYNLAFIPKDFRAEHKAEFDTQYMRLLYAKGFDMAIKGFPWKKTPPDY